MTKRNELARGAILMLAAAVLGLFGASVARGAETCNEVIGLCFEDEVVEDAHLHGDHVWSASGAAASVDESALSKYNLKDSDGYVRTNRTGTVILRYPVSCEGNLQTGRLFKINYKDDGAEARVEAKLIRTPLTTGSEPEVLAEFDSDSRPSLSDYQGYVAWLSDVRINGGSEGGFVAMECRLHTYHYEVRLTRGPGGDPRIRMLGIDDWEAEDLADFRFPEE